MGRGYIAANERFVETDLIFVHDLVLPCAIGAYDFERGHNQNVRFNIDADVQRNDRRFDDMRGVFSYDVIIDSIKIILGRGHVDLIETLASGIADEILRYPCVARVCVRIEKLDVVRGTVGVEIKRERAAEQAAAERRVRPLAGQVRVTKTACASRSSNLAAVSRMTPHCAAWLEALAAWGGPLILVPGGGPFADAVRAAQAAMGFDDAVAHRMALLGNGAIRCRARGAFEGFALAASRDELAALCAPDENSRLAAGEEWCLVAPEVPQSWDMTSDSLAAWLAADLWRRPAAADQILRFRASGLGRGACRGQYRRSTVSALCRAKPRGGLARGSSLAAGRREPFATRRNARHQARGSLIGSRRFAMTFRKSCRLFGQDHATKRREKS